MSPMYTLVLIITRPVHGVRISVSALQFCTCKLGFMEPVYGALPIRLWQNCNAIIGQRGGFSVCIIVTLL